MLQKESHLQSWLCYEPMKMYFIVVWKELLLMHAQISGLLKAGNSWRKNWNMLCM